MNFTKRELHIFVVSEICQQHLDNGTLRIAWKIFSDIYKNDNAVVSYIGLGQM